VTFFRKFADSQNWRLQLICQSPKTETPNNQIDRQFCYEALQDSPNLKRRLNKLVFDFSPDYILISSWPFKHFIQITKKTDKTRSICYFPYG